MDVPKTGGSAEGAVAAEPGAAEPAAAEPGAARAGGCPVDHSAVAAPAPPEAAAAPATIPATELPGPRTNPLFQMIKYWKRPADFMTQCRERYGTRFVVRIRVPPRPLYVLSDPNDIKQMFLTPADVLHTGNGSATLEKFFGQTGLAWLDENEHKVRRKHIMTSVHGKALERISRGIDRMAKEEIAEWPTGRPVSLHPYIHHFTLNVIREMIFGEVRPSCWDELLDILKQMMKYNDRIGSTIMIHRMSPAMVRLLLAIRPLGLHHFLKLRERADQLIADAVAERRAVGRLGDDMLSEMLRMTDDNGQPLGRVEMRNEIMTMFLAGTETTAAAIAWTFEYLSRDSESAVRERLVAELDKGDDAYLTATAQEILRLRPSVPQIIVREVMKPLELGGVRYEPGALLWASAYLMHRDTTLYPEPEQFRPERFLGSKPGMYTWIPYGGGRIRCLGAVIAELEMKAVIREVMTRYEMRRVSRQPERIRTHLITYLPEKGTRVELRVRQREASLAGR